MASRPASAERRQHLAAEVAGVVTVCLEIFVCHFCARSVNSGSCHVHGHFSLPLYLRSSRFLDSSSTFVRAALGRVLVLLAGGRTGVSALQLSGLTRVAVPIATHAKPLRTVTLTAAARSGLEEQIKTTIAGSKVVVYSKSYCPFCQATKELFDKMGVSTRHRTGQDGGRCRHQAALLSLSGQRTVPNVFVSGKHLGGNDDTQKAARAASSRSC